MKVSVLDIKDMDFPCDALILPVLEDEGIRPYKDIDEALGGLPGKAILRGEFRARQNDLLQFHTYGRIKPDRVLLIGLGKKDSLTPEKLRQAGGKSASYLREHGIKEAGLSTRLIRLAGLLPSDFIEGALLSLYRFTGYKKEDDRKEISIITVLSAEDLRAKMRWVEAVAGATNFARDLINTPANDMTPSMLEKTAYSLKGKGVSLNVIDKKEAERLGMGAYLSVAKGSNEPPKFIVLGYKGKETRPVVLIGKSITFDSGGISLKPAEGMEKMKYDMAGGAAVLGAIKAVKQLRLPLNIIGILPATENLPGGSASRPGDVVRTIGGKTIEIISTDAEGRLTLADALGYAKRFKPKAVIDIATLTGACSITFGGEAIAMLGNDDSLMRRMESASEATGERVWAMPLYDEYKEYLKSDVADLKNSSGKHGALLTAGYFLKELAGETPWVHLDIASTAWAEKDKPYTPRGATGIGVRLLMEFLKGYE